MRRAFTVVATAVVAAGGFAGPAAAATLPLCSPNDGYVPGETCEAAVVATPDCVNNTPVLDYAVTERAVGGAGTVDIRWTNLPGEDIVLANQPLTASDVAWPAGADASVTLVFGTSPSSTRVNVTADSACSASLVSAAVGGSGAESGVLAATGSEALPLALGGAALVVGGAALVLARRRQSA